jgi:NAD(P)H-dependent FMN reductase
MIISILYGAVRPARKSFRCALALEAALRATGRCDPRILDLADYNLPVMHERFFEMANPPALVTKLHAALDESDGLVFLSPEYNGSYSGALKNAVDYFRPEFNKKPIGVATASSGKFAGINASHHLQALVLHIGGYGLPRKWMVPDVEKNLNEDGTVQNEAVAKELAGFAEEMVWITEAVVARKGLQKK